MTVRQAIAEQVDKLPPELQEQVLRYVTSLKSPQELVGEKGTALLQFASLLDAESAREMTKAIEECERIDADQW